MLSDVLLKFSILSLCLQMFLDDMQSLPPTYDPVSLHENSIQGEKFKQMQLERNTSMKLSEENEQKVSFFHSTSTMLNIQFLFLAYRPLRN